MITFTSVELNAWITGFFFPLTRVLALLAAAPPFNNPGLSVRIRLGFGLVITLAIAPILPPIAPLEPASAIGLLIMAQQILIGLAMGLSLRLIFSAIDMGGALISQQAGLGFAMSYDPQNASQTPVISELLGILALLVFLAINGHLMVLSTLVESFTTIPIGVNVVASVTWKNIAQAGGVIFSSGILIALPISLALLITNTALGVLGRIAPQLNLMAVGFPITIALTLSALLVSLTYLAAPVQALFSFGLRSMTGFFILN